MKSSFATLTANRKRYREQVAITVPPACLLREIGDDKQQRPFVVHGVAPSFSGPAHHDVPMATATYRMPCKFNHWLKRYDQETQTHSVRPCLGQCTHTAEHKPTLHYDCVYQAAK